MDPKCVCAQLPWWPQIICPCGHQVGFACDLDRIKPHKSYIYIINLIGGTNIIANYNVGTSISSTWNQLLPLTLYPTLP